MYIFGLHTHIHTNTPTHIYTPIHHSYSYISIYIVKHIYTYIWSEVVTLAPAPQAKQTGKKKLKPYTIYYIHVLVLME